MGREQHPGGRAVSTMELEPTPPAPGADPASGATPAPAGGDAARSPRREATRQRVLDAAREVFAERGVIGGTVEDICERAGYTRGAFYSNFADKEDVIGALVEREQNRLLDGLDAMFAGVEAEIAAAVDLATVLQAIIDRVLLAVPIDRELSLIQAELEIYAIRRPDLAGRFLSINERLRQRVTAFITHAMRRNGREILVEPSILTDAILGITRHSVRRALLDEGDGDPNEMAGAILPGLLLAFSRPSGDTPGP